MKKKLLTWTASIGLTLAGVYVLVRYTDLSFWLSVVAVITAVILAIAMIRAVLRAIRRKSLMTKYQDAAVVDELMDRRFWQGQTAEQLVDAIGRPDDIDQKVLKTKKKEIWKYDHQGRNRYGLRITLDDDLVVGWEQND